MNGGGTAEVARAIIRGMAALAKSVDEYIASQPEGSREVLAQVRKAIRAALPRAEETISYRIPTYKLNGDAVIYFAGWKKHYSVYPAGKRIVEALRDELAAYEINKSTIRFALDDQVPVKLIGKIARLRAKAVAERE